MTSVHAVPELEYESLPMAGDRKVVESRIVV